MHQIPQHPPYLRVKIWRRLQRLGAVALKNAVYVLPRSEQNQEDLQWLAREITSGGGEATVLEARLLDGVTNEQMIAQFRSAREADYAQLCEEARQGLEGPAEALAQAELARLKQRQAALLAIDFFEAPGREVLQDLVRKLESRLQSLGLPPQASPSHEAYHRRVWVTRAGIASDRMASAWLIRRFIDPEARFRFVPSTGHLPETGELRFDMFEAEFTHEGDNCTFEVLQQRFDLREPALSTLGEIIHDIDLKDEKFRHAETAGLALVIASLVQACPDDEERLARSTVLFDELFAHYRRHHQLASEEASP